MSNSAPPYYYPNRLGRLILLAFEEVIGRSGLNEVLNLSSLPHLIESLPPDDEIKAISFETISQLQHALEQEFGPHGGHGLALRAGRVFFSNGLRTYGPKLGLNEANFRLQPPELKFLDVLDTITVFFNRHTDQQVILEQSEQSYLWRIERCPWCWEREEFEPVCHFVVGMLQEALHWVSGGKYYTIVEETCIAQGEPVCLIVINRDPLA